MQKSLSRVGLSLLVLASTIGVLAGCGSGEPTMNLVPVTGTVTLNGEPLEEANVRFFDVNGKNQAASGKTDSDGKYNLGFSTYKGAMAGQYKVVIEHLTDLKGKPLIVDEGMDAQMLMMEGKAKQNLHPNYSSFTDTKLSAEVKSGSTKAFDFALKTDGS